MKKLLWSILILLTAILLYQLGYIRACDSTRKGLECRGYSEPVVEAKAIESPEPSSSSVAPIPEPVVAVNMDALARAVSAHETCGCTCGIVLPEPNPDGVNNCFGIKDKATCRPKNYDTKGEAYDDFKALWKSRYGGFPTLETASRYVGHDGTAWLADVTKYYNKYNIQP